jgi:small subunit ribosomal protein S6
VNLLRTYETLYIVRPDVPEDEVQNLAKEVESQITTSGGAIVQFENWGKRRLAYEVQKFAEGYYLLTRFTATPAFVARLENYFRLTDSVIRYLLLHFDDRTLRLEDNQRKRKEAEIRNSAITRRREDDDDDEDDVAPARSRRYNDDDDRDDLD